MINQLFVTLLTNDLSLNQFIRTTDLRFSVYVGRDGNKKTLMTFFNGV